MASQVSQEYEALAGVIARARAEAAGSLRREGLPEQEIAAEVDDYVSIPERREDLADLDYLVERLPLISADVVDLFSAFKIENLVVLDAAFRDMRSGNGSSLERYVSSLERERASRRSELDDLSLSYVVCHSQDGDLVCLSLSDAGYSGVAAVHLLPVGMRRSLKASSSLAGFIEANAAIAAGYFRRMGRVQSEEEDWLEELWREIPPNLVEREWYAHAMSSRSRPL